MSEPVQTVIRALLVDDHALFRESVARVLNGDPGLEIDHCNSIREALALLAQRQRDLVLLDHDLGSERASQFLPAARQIGFEGRVLVVTAWISDTEARRLMRQGVSGIFLKQGPLSELTQAIRVVASGGTWLDRGFAAREDELSHSAPQAGPPVFNERQRKVLRFVLEGLSNKEIAWRLQISESYVKAILQGLFQKTGVRTRGQLVRVAVEQYEDQM
jgi:two-component system, NarL family, nitrate/nitrite response regulator NarL